MKARVDDVIVRAARARRADDAILRALTWPLAISAFVAWLSVLWPPAHVDCRVLQREARGELRLLADAARRGTLAQWRPVTARTHYAYVVDADSGDFYAVAQDAALGVDTWRLSSSTGALAHVVEGCPR